MLTAVGGGRPGVQTIAALVVGLYAAPTSAAVESDDHMASPASDAGEGALIDVREEAPRHAASAARSRIVLGGTATTLPAGELDWQMSNIVVHELHYGLADDVQLGVRTAVPAVYIFALPNLTWGTQLSDRWRVGIDVTIGAFWPYMEVEELEAVSTGRAVIAGGGVALTYSTASLTFNVGLPVYYARYGHKEFSTQIVDMLPVTLSRLEFSNIVAAIPHAGVVARVSDTLFVHGELHIPVGNFDNVGRVALGFYGLRLFVDRAYLDLSFALPIYPGAGGFYELLPLGVPLAAFGVVWGAEPS